LTGDTWLSESRRATAWCNRTRLDRLSPSKTCSRAAAPHASYSN
jgi:hypothetical protein